MAGHGTQIAGCSPLALPEGTDGCFGDALHHRDCRRHRDTSLPAPHLSGFDVSIGRNSAECDRTMRLQSRDPAQKSAVRPVQRAGASQLRLSRTADLHAPAGIALHDNHVQTSSRLLASGYAAVAFQGTTMSDSCKIAADRCRCLSTSS